MCEGPQERNGVPWRGRRGQVGLPASFLDLPGLQKHPGSHRRGSGQPHRRGQSPQTGLGFRDQRLGLVELPEIGELAGQRELIVHAPDWVDVFTVVHRGAAQSQSLGQVAGPPQQDRLNRQAHQRGDVTRLVPALPQDLLGHRLGFRPAQEEMAQDQAGFGVGPGGERSAGISDNEPGEPKAGFHVAIYYRVVSLGE